MLALGAFTSLLLACGSSGQNSTGSATAKPTPTPIATTASAASPTGKYQRNITDLDTNNGTWTMQFGSVGLFTLHTPNGHDHQLTYSVSGDRITMREMEMCPEDGTYTWMESGGMLTFHVVTDDCKVTLRPKVLADGPWTRV